MATKLLWMIIYPGITLIGTVGLSFITVTNKHSKKSSYTVYLSALAIVDTLALYSLFFQLWLPETFGINFQDMGIAICKLQTFSTYFLGHFAASLIALLALERSYCVYFPHHVKSVCRPRNAFITTGIIGIVLFAYNSHYLYGMKLHSIIFESHNTAPCTTVSDESNTVNNNNRIFPSLLNVRKPETLNNSSHDDLRDFSTLNQSATNATNIKTSQNLTFGSAVVKVDKGIERQLFNLFGFMDQNNVSHLIEATCKVDKDNHTVKTPIVVKNKTLTLTNHSEYIPVHVCGFTNGGYSEFYKWWIWVDVLVYFCLPTLIIIVANIATWIKVLRSANAALSTSTTLTLRRTRHVMVLTLLISVSYIMFVTPMSVLLTYESSSNEDLKDIYEFRASREIVEFIVQCLYISNHAFNFFLYILSGARFREDLKAAICKPKSKNRESR